MGTDVVIWEAMSSLQVGGGRGGEFCGLVGSLGIGVPGGFRKRCENCRLHWHSYLWPRTHTHIPLSFLPPQHIQSAQSHCNIF